MSGSLHFFAIPTLDQEAAQVALDRQWLAAGLDSCWVICVIVAAEQGPLPASLKLPGSKGARADKVDYREVLNPARGWIPAGTAVPRRTDQTRFSEAAARPEVQGTRGVGGAAAAARQLPGPSLVWKRGT